MTRRSFAAALAAAPALMQGQEIWIQLFNGRSLEGWKANENADSWKVEDGCLVGSGHRSHLFYTGPLNDGSFKNFEAEFEVLTAPACNSGFYFHTRFQEQGWPAKGFEVQVNNTATGEGTYRERKRTGSLYGIRNVYKVLGRDNEWTRMRVEVRGKNVKVRVNDQLVVDYIEPTTPIIPSPQEKERFIDRGAFALQCHDPGSRVRFRNIRVRPLADDIPSPAAIEADETYKKIVLLGGRNYPVVDFHVHLKMDLTLPQALERSLRDGIGYGIAVNGGVGFQVKDDAAAEAFLRSLGNAPVFTALQGEGREWTTLFTKAALSKFDYVFTDSMTWTDNRGRRMRLWIPAEVGEITDKQEFMDTLVGRTVGILEKEPIDIYVNPTFIPDSISKEYDALWTEERMKKVIDAAAKNQVAIEINNRYKLPSARFIRMAKEAGCKFSFGSNNTSANDLGRCEYGIQMVEECKLGWQDFFVPGAWWPKAIERKPQGLSKPA